MLVATAVLIFNSWAFCRLNRLSFRAIGIGFRANLSGLENIYLSGLLLRFTEKEIKKRLPEIILIDEVLSVGDINIRAKSYEKMNEIIKDKNKTVMIVSHSNASILEFCDEVIWIHDGLVKEYGPAQQVVEDYEGFMRRYRKRHAADAGM